jgi:hypothetical protein
VVVVAAVVAVLSAAASGISAIRRWATPQSPRTLTELADDLVKFVDKDLYEEADRRDLNDRLGLIPLTWTGGGMTQVQDFDHATRSLASGIQRDLGLDVS